MFGFDIKLLTQFLVIFRCSVNCSGILAWVLLTVAKLEAKTIDFNNFEDIS